MDTVRLSAVELAAAIRKGRVSVIEVVDQVLGQISGLDGELKAFITVDADGGQLGRPRGC